eukprot:Tamp_11922.p1 GENE.Tamp_11922~~Tamp_11922.p1  ORF type:complete len:396 (+),score=60.62 Tamp_11922:132-1319(+)
MWARVLVVAALLLSCAPMRGVSLPAEPDDWGASTVGGVLRDLAVGTVAAGVADTAAAPLCTLKTLIQTGRGLSALHTKAVELLDGKGKPVKEHGVVKLVHVPLSPAQILAQLLQGGKVGQMRTIELLGPLGAGVLTCLSYRLASVFALLLPSLGDLGGLLASMVAGAVVAALEACAHYRMPSSTSSTSSPPFSPLLLAGQSLQRILVADMLRRSKQAEYDSKRRRWSSLRRKSAFSLEGGGRGAVVAAFLHALFSAARIALEVSAARGKWGGWENEERVCGPLQVAESAVRGGTMHLLLMHGHAWLRQTRRSLAALVSGQRQRGESLEGPAGESWSEGRASGIREGGFMTLEQAKRLRVGDDELVVVDVPYDEDIGVDLPQEGVPMSKKRRGRRR